MKQILSISLLALFISGCANSDARILEATAFELDKDSSNVIILSTDKGAFDTKWKAQAGGDIYNCKATDMLENVRCKKQD